MQKNSQISQNNQPVTNTINQGNSLNIKVIKIDEYEGMAPYNIIKIQEKASAGPGGKIWDSVIKQPDLNVSYGL